MEEHIWVDKDFADRWHELKSKKATREEQEKVFDEYCKQITSQVRKDFAINLESLEEDAAMFRGLMIKVKKTFEETKNEYLEASEAVWEKFEKEVPSIQKNIDRLTKLIDPLSKQLDVVKKKFETISTYNYKQVVELIQLVSSLNDKNKNTLDLILKYNKED